MTQSITQIDKHFSPDVGVMLYSNFIIIDENSLPPHHLPPFLPFLGAPGISWDPTSAIGINIIIVVIILVIVISITEQIPTCYNSNGINVNWTLVGF